MILITSANGKTGRKVIPQLAAKGLAVRALDISPQSVELKTLGVHEVMVGDMRDPAVLKKAMSGIQTVIHIGPPVVPYEGDIGKAVVDAASSTKVGYFIQFSVTHPQISALLNHQAKLVVEEHLINSGLDYTILQPMHYMQNINIEQVLQQGVLIQMYHLDTRLSVVDMEDVAEVAARVVTEKGHVGATYELCGSDFLSTNELADIIAQQSVRKEIKARLMPIDEFLALPFIAGLGDYSKEGLRRLFTYYGQHGIRGNPNVLTWLLGRKPTTFVEYVRREMNRIS